MVPEGLLEEPAATTRPCGRAASRLSVLPLPRQAPSLLSVRTNNHMCHHPPKAPQLALSLYSTRHIFMPPQLQTSTGSIFRIFPLRFLVVLLLVLLCIVNMSWMTSLYSRGQKGPYPITRMRSPALVYFPPAVVGDKNFCACYAPPSSSLDDVASILSGLYPPFLIFHCLNPLFILIFQCVA